MEWPLRITTVAGEVDALFWLVLAITGMWFVAAQAFLVFCLSRFRRPGAGGQSRNGHRPGAVLLGLGVAVLACDFAIEAYSLPVWRAMKEELPPPAIEIRAVAKQFRWRFVYPGPDQRFGTDDDRSLDSELHLPSGTNVRVVLQSEDVIHSFFVPAARLKQDVLPGRQTSVSLRLEREGRFEIACAELCGFAHYTMRGFLIVHSPQDYREWQAQEWEAEAAHDGAVVNR